MQINKVAFIGKGGVGLLYGSMIARALGDDAVEYVMDDARFERHANDAPTVNGKPCASQRPYAPARQRPPIWSS